LLLPAQPEQNRANVAALKTNHFTQGKKEKFYILLASGGKTSSKLDIFLYLKCHQPKALLQPE